MNRISKQKLVESYLKLFCRYESIFLFKNLGLSISDLNYVRINFKEIGSRMIVIKNSLAKIALNNTEFVAVKSLLFGPIVIVYSNDPVITSRLLIKLCSTNDKLNIAGGILSGKILNKEEIFFLSKMFTQHEVREKIVWLLKFVVVKLAATIREPLIKIIKILNLR